ncbi:MFS transporter [Noviherbaspirillum sedimenti]|uniref:MFS transporter n=1 Tax=Noviherbaspirillum sedimenti TaxID=2320865 RepID=A0A3A3G8V5_9BURK|nr:MFS transporter [Noviherbaspirillum sedimenti]RJG03002.1 MFS transporter [Noviherbaspirillum sedimenti]
MGMHFGGATTTAHHPAVSRTYAWIVFALIFCLMLSDYLSRQVINVLFPFLKAEWALSDTQLGSLVSVVALTVGILTFPISLAADRWGRVRSVTAMALLWGLATVACGLAGSFMSLFLARMLVGLGEAGYSSAGGAILLSVFPQRLHATVMGAFLAAALFGSVLGVVLGGAIAAHLGWRMAFIIVGAGGLVLAIIFPMVVREPAKAAAPSSPGAQADSRMPLKTVFRELFAARTAVFSYLGSGFQMFTLGAVMAWMPSYLNRYYGMTPNEAGIKASVLVLMAGVGMVLGGIVVDRLVKRERKNVLLVMASYAFGACALMVSAFILPPGTAQFSLIAMAMVLAGAPIGPVGAVATGVSDPRIHATVLATGTIANNILGLAPGPFVTGLIADRANLQVALEIIPLASLIAALCFAYARRYYDADARRIAGAARTGEVADLSKAA